MTENEHHHPLVENQETGAPVESESSRSKELEFDRFLLEHAPVNSGTKALIFKVEAAEIPAEVAEKYTTAGSKTDNAALKVLKVYNRGRGEAEFQAQMHAYQMVEQARLSGQDVAWVPTPLEWQSVRIEDETKKVLNTEGAHLLSNDAELLVMDFVEGEDLATVFYKWIIEHVPADKQYLVQNVNPSNFEDLQRAVSEILEFIRPGGKGSNEAARVGEERRVTNMNAEKTYRFLKKSGFRLNPRVIAQIKNTFRIFKDNGFYHNDDHERNFMVTGDYSGDGEVQAYVVDFDKAGQLAEGHTGDFRIDRLLAQLVEEQEPGLRTEIDSRLSNVEWQKRMSGILEMNPGTDLKKALLRNSMTAASSEAAFEDLAALITSLNSSQRLDREDALKILDSVRESLVVRSGRNQTPRIISPNIYNKATKYKALFQEHEQNI